MTFWVCTDQPGEKKQYSAIAVIRVGLKQIKKTLHLPFFGEEEVIRKESLLLIAFFHHL